MRFDFVSPKFCQIYGLAEVDFSRDPSLAFSLTHPDDSKNLIDANQYAVETGENFHWEGRFVVNKKIIWVEISSEPSLLPNGNTLWSGIIQDISERKKMEDEIRSSEQHLKLYREQAPMATIEWNPDFQVVDWNKAAEKMFGYSVDEVKGRDFVDVMLAESAVVDVKQIWNELITQTGGEISTNENITKDGRIILCEWHNTPLIDELDNLIGVVSIVQDVTNRKKMEDEIRSSEQHLKLYREQAPMATIEWNPDFQVVDWNKAAEKMFGYTVDEVKGRNFADIMLPDSAIVDVKQIWKDLMSKTGGTKSVNENITKNGGTILCEWHNTPLIDDLGNVIGAASIVQDITDRVQQEEQLNRSQKMDALGKLTGGIAHDYNNMLGVILGYSDLLYMKLKDDPELHEYTQQIHRAANRGTKLTTKLLSYTRNTFSDEESLIINTLLEYEKDMLEKTLTARIKLHYEFDDELWPVVLDSSELEDVIINLSINAMHAIDSNGDLTITTKNITLKEAEAQSLELVAGDYVQMSFTDTGSGMDEVTKSKMFDPFYSTKGDKGTGLGLSQVYGFAQRSKGGISVKSQLGKGTELRLYFPRGNISTSSVQLENKELTDDLNGTEVILLVDDEEALRNLTSIVLTEHGYKVICANDGKQALEILEKKSVDILLSDVIMPEMDGFQLAKVVNEKYPAIKIQLASGYTDNRESEHKKETWYNEILYKPIHAKNLLLRIRELLD